jgi:hypothetical protein
MKILAFEKETPNTTPEQFAPHLKTARWWTHRAILSKDGKPPFPLGGKYP